MHGRVKVWVSEEQERVRKAKKELIENKFRTITDSLLLARRNGDLTEAQISNLNTVLEIVPDMNTLWNYRREILLHIFSISDSPKDQAISMLNKDLDLTARCLLNFPKSYATWHHRKWVMKNHPDANWEGEIKFCNAALKMDERNFHCWDYRRFIVKYGKISTASELAYIEDEIEANMSNYSAWHYRSELLSSRSPSISSSYPLSPPPHMFNKQLDHEFLDESIPPQEVDLVHNAIFTDPNDQSPWFYYRWLLGHGLRKSYLRDLYICRSLQRVIIVFTSPKARDELEQLDVSVKVFLDTDEDAANTLSLSVENLGGWQSALTEPLSSVWWFSISHETLSSIHSEFIDKYYTCQLNFEVYICIRDLKNESCKCHVFGCLGDHLSCLKCILDSKQNESLTRVNLDPLRLLNPAISPAHDPEDLLEELNNVRELLSTEAENKWALLSFVDLLRFIHPPESKKEISNAIDTLIRIDSLRAAYYFDMKASHATQDALVKAYDAHTREISLNNLGIVNLYYLDWCALMTKIDLSGNAISVLPDTLAYLVCLSDLNLDDNRLQNLKGISRLPSLLRLSVQRNCLCDFESIEELLFCPVLQHVAIHGNEVTNLPDLTKLISEHPSSKCKSHSFSVTYDKTLNV